jgi:hypothetical protein
VVAGPEGFGGGPLTVYTAGRIDAVVARLEVAPSRAEVADLIFFEPPEDAVLVEPRTIEQHPATNRVITFLDLSVVHSTRYDAARDAVWAEGVA